MFETREERMFISRNGRSAFDRLHELSAKVDYVGTVGLTVAEKREYDRLTGWYAQDSRDANSNPFSPQGG
jgi:hypothetical protein